MSLASVKETLTVNRPLTNPVSMLRASSETGEYGKMVRRMIRAYSRRVGAADEVDLAELLMLRDEVEQAIAHAVFLQRRDYGRSWAYIARGLGVTRQAAQMRYGWAGDDA